MEYSLHLLCPLGGSAVNRSRQRRRASLSLSVFKQACAWLVLAMPLCLLYAGQSDHSVEPVVELVAVGDILLDRGVARRIEREGTRAVFKPVRGIIEEADLAFGNLESPVTVSCERKPRGIAFRAEPRNLSALTHAGLDIVSLANNHSLDCGGTGLLETMRHLKELGLGFCGAGRTRREAEAPVVLNVKGIRIAFVALTAIAPWESASSKEDGPSVALASGAAIERAVTSARSSADLVVASLHWGAEYASRPNSEQLELARAATRAGADLILGHHTHTLEGLELIEGGDNGEGRRRRALVAYSLGNFAFDSPRAIGRRVIESVILRCRFNRSGLVSAELVPVILENYTPRPARAEEAETILTRLTALSSELKTRVSDGRVDFSK